MTVRLTANSMAKAASLGSFTCAVSSLESIRRSSSRTTSSVEVVRCWVIFSRDSVRQDLRSRRLPDCHDALSLKKEPVAPVTASLVAQVYSRLSVGDVAKTSGAYMKSEGPNTFKGLDMAYC